MSGPPEDIGRGPKVSLITICRNEKLIEETCRSVAAQVYDDFEWLVIDGASTDGTLEVLERYRGRMSYFISEPDGGRYQAMNKGIRAARGEYLLFLNGGDALADPLALERIFNYRPANKLLAIVAPDLTADIVFGETVTRETGFVPWPIWVIGPRWLDLRFFKSNSLPHQSTFIRKRLFEDIGLYDESYKTAGDYEWFMRAVLLHRADYEYLPTVVSVYNFEGVSSSQESIAESGHDRECARAYKKYSRNLAVRLYQLLRFRYLQYLFFAAANLIYDICPGALRKYFKARLGAFYQKKVFRRNYINSDAVILKLQGRLKKIWRRARGKTAGSHIADPKDEG